MRFATTLLDGFFPFVPVDAEPQRGARAGLHEMGLPYVSDPAITRHLAGFLKKHWLPPSPRARSSSTAASFSLHCCGERVVEVLRTLVEHDRTIPGSRWC